MSKIMKSWGWRPARPEEKPSGDAPPPPPTGKPIMKIRIDCVRGEAGDALYINEYRVAGVKPWGGGRVLMSWMVDKKEIMTALEE